MATQPQQPETSQPEQTRDPRRWLVLAVMSLGTLIVFLDLTVVNTALPAIAQDLRASTSQLQWVVDSYVLALAGLLMLAGSIGDRFGRKRWMTLGLVVFAVGSALGGIADSVSALIVARATQGVGAAFVLPATLSIVTNTFDRDERGKAIAIWTAIGGMGIGFGPAIGGFLVDRFDWSAAFWIHLPIIAVALIGQLIVAESRDSRTVGLDVPGAITATLGITALVFGIIQGAEAGWSSPLIIASFVAAVMSLAAFVAIERNAAHPMLPLHFFKNRDFTGSVIVLAAMFFAVPSMFFFLTQFFQIVQGKDPFEAGLIVLPNAAAIVFASAVAPRLAARIGPRAIVVLSVSLMALAVFLFTGVDPEWSSLREITTIMLLGLGFGLGMPSLTDMVMASVPVEDAGVGSAVNDVARELGSALGIAVVGSFLSSVYRSNVEKELAGQVPADVLEVASEGIGTLAGSATSLDPETAAIAMNGATTAFVDALNSGLGVSVAVLVVAAAVALWLLPNQARAEQVERSDAPDTLPSQSQENSRIDVETDPTPFVA